MSNVYDKPYAFLDAVRFEKKIELSCNIIHFQVIRKTSLDNFFNPLQATYEKPVPYMTRHNRGS